MKKTFAVKLFAVLMAVCLVFAGCSSEKTTNADEGENGHFGINSSDGSGVSLLKRASDAFEKKYEKLLDFDFDNLAVEADVEITLGESFGSFVDIVSGSSVSGIIDELGLESAKISADFDRNGDVYSLTADAFVNDKLIVDADAVFDYAGEMLYLALPELADGTVGLDASEMIESIEYEVGDAIAEFSEIYENQLDAQKKLTEGLEKYLSEDEIMAILEDYAETGMAELDEPEVKETEISVDGIEQKVEAQVYEVTAEDAGDFCEAVLEKLYNDEDIKEKFLAVYPLIYNYLDVVSNGELTSYAESDAEEVYDEFLSEIDDVLDDLDDEFDGDAVVYITCYFADDSFAGFSVEEKEEDFNISFYNVRNGNDVALSCDVDDGYGETTSFKLVGNDKGGKYNGVFTVSPAYSDFVSIRIEDFDLNKFAEGSISGTVAMYAKDMPADVSDSVPEGFAFKLRIDSDYLTYSNFGIIIENDGENVITANVNLSFSDDADKVSVPSNYIDAEDQTAISGWAQSLLANVNLIIENLTEAGISEEVISLIASNL